MTREQDVKVAEYLGWDSVQEDAYTPAGKRVCGTPPPGVVPMWSTGRSEVPRYSTDIAAAWIIVEHLRDQWTEATAGVSGWDNNFQSPFHDAHFFDRLHRHADRRWPWAFLYVTPQAIVDAFLAMKDNEAS